MPVRPCPETIHLLCDRAPLTGLQQVCSDHAYQTETLTTRLYRDVLRHRNWHVNVNPVKVGSLTNVTDIAMMYSMTASLENNA